MTSIKVGTVALIIGEHKSTGPILVDSLSDDREIAVLESALESKQEDPLGSVYMMRAKQAREDEEFGNYVEDLLSQPFVRPDIQEHGIQWLRSKIRIEQYQRCEAEATKVIAEYAFKLYQENPGQKEFFLAGPVAKVRIVVFTIGALDAVNSGSKAA